MHIEIKFCSWRKFRSTDESFFVRARGIIVIKIREVEIASLYNQIVKN